MEELNNIINSKKHNIGSLCLFINKRLILLNILDEYIDNYISNDINLTLAQKIYIYDNNYFDIFCECGKLKHWKSFKLGWTKTCGDKNCIKNSTIKTNNDKYGFDNPMKNDTIKKQIQETNIKKYGVTNTSKLPEVRKKISIIYNNKTDDEKNIIINKRIENWKNKTDDVKELIKNKTLNTNNNKSDLEKEKTKEKRKNTCLKKYDNEYAISSLEIREKIVNTFNEKYNGNTPFSDKKIKDKAIISYQNSHIEYIKCNIVEQQCKYISHIDKGNSNIEYTLLCSRTNKIFTIGYSNLRNRIISKIEISPYFIPKHGKSEMECNLLNFIKINYNNIILSNKKNIIPPLELDIYIPDLKLAFEFNGIYWHDETHKENNYHLNKTILCEKQCINLIHIWEDDWLYKQEIVKSIILNKLGKYTKTIKYQECIIEELTDNKLVKEFLDNNHIDGFISSKIKIGLFYENELVSIMTFGNKRNECELIRTCNKLNTNVIDSELILFRYFLEKYKPTKIHTQVDISIVQNELFEKLGFEIVNKTQPNYKYVVDGIRCDKNIFNKKLLIKDGYNSDKTEHEIMLERKIFRIYDCGKIKFIYNNK